MKDFDLSRLILFLLAVWLFTLPALQSQATFAGNQRGDPQIAVSPDTLDFGSPFVCSAAGGEIEIQNLGGDPLQINGFFSANPVFEFTFSIDPPFQIPPANGVTVSMSFIALAPGYHEGELQIVNNDPLHDTVSVYLRVTVLPWPFSSYWPPSPLPFSINETVPEGDSLTLQIEVLNASGGILDWSSEIVYSDENIRPSSCSLGDTLFALDVTALTPAQDNLLRGVEFDGGNFWIAGADPVSGAPKIYRFDEDWNYLESFFQPGGNLFGFGDVTLFDLAILLGNINSLLYQVDLLNGSVLGMVNLPISSLKGLALDPDLGYLWTSLWSGSVYVLNLNGAMVNQFPYSGPPINGMGWDDATPGGPFLWTWAADGPPQGPNCTALQWDPNAGQPTGVSFVGIEMNGDPAANDQPGGATVRFVDDQLALLAVHSSNRQPGDGHDFVVAYSLGYERYHWLSIAPNAGSLPPCAPALLEVTLRGIKGAGGNNLRNAEIIFYTNDPFQPVITWLVEMAVGPPVALAGRSDPLPGKFILYQNYPNPFNPGTAISYQLSPKGQAALSHVELAIYNLLGQKVRTLVQARQPAGRYEVKWDGRNTEGVHVSGGIYFYRLSVENQFVQTRKMTLVR
ncbi:MAG: T9SS type A sorting domain-containing protein [Calditrichaceae bacterium]|nr:T9SS type A sorting domain-containing protein [Calditrichia bacterium]NUQ43225.1 T9SS type A sorting domain-containing protein [Calditrichaceae bacterium]